MLFPGRSRMVGKTAGPGTGKEGLQSGGGWSTLYEMNGHGHKDRTEFLPAGSAEGAGVDAIAVVSADGMA